MKILPFLPGMDFFYTRKTNDIRTAERGCQHKSIGGMPYLSERFGNAYSPS